MPRKNPLPETELNIGQRVRIVRERLGLSRTVFARELGLDSSAITNVELGRTPLHYDTGLRLSSRFFVNPRWLATGLLPVRFQMHFYGHYHQLPPKFPFGLAYREKLARPVEKALAEEAKKRGLPIEELDAIGERPVGLAANSAEAIAERNRRIMMWAESVLASLPPDLHEAFLTSIGAASDSFYRDHAKAISEFREGLAMGLGEQSKPRRKTK